MAYLRRNRKGRKKAEPDGPEGADPSDAKDAPGEPTAAGRDPQASSPQRVGIVSGVLTTSATSERSDETSLFGSVVERRFGPSMDRDTVVDAVFEDESGGDLSDDDLGQLGPLTEDDSMLEEESESLNLEIDPMAHIGNATTIVGNIVAEEDLEIQGTIEGSVQLANHRLRVGVEGIVTASVEARTVEVIGKITGNVTATELVEIKAGGVIGGDIKAPRVIMNDGAIVIGGLDMSAALQSHSESADVTRPLPPISTQPTAPTAQTMPTTPATPSTPLPDRPKLIKVEAADDASSEEDRA